MSIIQLETLESLLEFNTKFAQDYFNEHGELQTMVVGYNKDNTKRICILGDFNQDMEKMRWTQFVKTVFAYFDIDKYVFMSEGWALKAATIEERQQFKSISEHPARIEVLSILAINRHGQKATIKEIDKDRKLIDFEATPGRAEGVMCDLLPPMDMPQDIKAKAKVVIDDMRKHKFFTEEELTLKGDA